MLLMNGLGQSQTIDIHEVMKYLIGLIDFVKG
jgi:hypothetical protein